MHELSIVMSIIDIATQQATNANATLVDEIELDVGALSGIEMNAFDFAWKQAVEDSILQNATLTINRIEGKAICIDCSASFEIQQYFDACPVCGEHLINIIQGKELKVKSLVVS